jgi:hypothetical protein
VDKGGAKPQGDGEEPMTLLSVALVDSRENITSRFSAWGSFSAASPFLAFNLRDSRFHEFLDERDGQWLVRGEVNGSL